MINLRGALGDAWPSSESCSLQIQADQLKRKSEIELKMRQHYHNAELAVSALNAHIQFSHLPVYQSVLNRNLYKNDRN